VPLDGEKQKYCISKESIFIVIFQVKHETASVLYRIKFTIQTVDEPGKGDED
jgi:hypothetical protein